MARVPNEKRRNLPPTPGTLVCCLRLKPNQKTFFLIHLSSQKSFTLSACKCYLRADRKLFGFLPCFNRFANRPINSSFCELLDPATKLATIANPSVGIRRFGVFIVDFLIVAFLVFLLI